MSTSLSSSHELAVFNSASIDYRNPNIPSGPTEHLRGASDDALGHRRSLPVAATTATVRRHLQVRWSSLDRSEVPEQGQDLGHASPHCAAGGCTGTGNHDLRIKCNRTNDLCDSFAIFCSKSKRCSFCYIIDLWSFRRKCTSCSPTARCRRPTRPALRSTKPSTLSTPIRTQVCHKMKSVY